MFSVSCIALSPSVTRRSVTRKKPKQMMGRGHQNAYIRRNFNGLFRAHGDAQWSRPLVDPELILASTPGGPNDPPDRKPGLPGTREDEDVDVEDKPISQTPRRFKVIFHNDDYTTQEFVVYVLMRFFNKSETEAQHIMLTVHHKGAAVAGVYTKDIRSEEHTSELQSQSNLVCRLLLEKKKNN